MQCQLVKFAPFLLLAVSTCISPCQAQNVVNYREIADPLLFLLREPAVHAELKLTASQRQQLTAFNETHDAVLLSTRNQNPKDAEPAVKQVFVETREKLETLLNPRP